MNKHLLVINGHPEPRPERFCSALSLAFADGARLTGWNVHALSAATLQFSSGKTQTEITPDMAAGLVNAADRLAIVFPLWFEEPPALVGKLLEHAATLRRVTQKAEVSSPRTAQLVVTMEMPAFIHRSLVRADSRRGDGRELDSLPGFDSAYVTFIGSVGAITLEQRQQWLHEIRRLGGQSDRLVRLPRKWLSNSLTARAA